MWIGENNNVSCVKEENVIKMSREQYYWTHAATKLLLELRLKRESEFNHPVGLKKDLWAQIASEMQVIGGYAVNSELCDSKYRNLLATYKVNKKKALENEDNSITWEYYKKFDEVLGLKAFKEKTGSCKKKVLPECSTVGIQIEGAVLPGISDSANDNNEDAPVPKKLKMELSMKEYLFLRNEREEKSLVINKQIELKKLKLKEKEIEVLRQLAAAIFATTKER
ncbi:hypothetical protein C0J52_03374 [Blattella germanica]|nr:hypothetical protein C0J52_03374 [Blattella germanica]